MQLGTARLPRAQSALAMTNLGAGAVDRTAGNLQKTRDVEDAVPYKACAVGDSSTKFMACMALTKRRYRRNWFLPF